LRNVPATWRAYPIGVRVVSGYPRSIARGAVRLSGYLTWPIVMALGSAMFFAVVTSLLVGTDAATYYAAAERLNAGHALYALSPGDRFVPIDPPYWTAPLLSPPLIAVVFRPLALLPIEIAVRILVAFEVIGITAVILALVRDRPTGIIAVIMSFPLGLAMVLGNVNGLLLIGYVGAWRFRDRPWVGALIAVMGMIKIVPFVLVGFLVARRDWRALMWFGVGCILCVGVSLVGAGWDAHVDYLGVLATSLPQPLSIPDLLGVTWVSPAILVVGTVIAASLPSAWSYRVAIVTIVFGTPAVGVAIASQLIAVLAPSSAPRERR
jgi:hypothetical protein